MKKYFIRFSFCVILSTSLFIFLGCKSTPSNTQNILSGTYAYSGDNYIIFTENTYFGSFGSTYLSGTFVVDGSQLTLIRANGSTRTNWQIIDNKRIRDIGGYIWYKQSERRHRQLVQLQYEIEQRQQLEEEQRQQVHEAMLRQRGITEEQWQAEQAEIRRRETQARQEQEALSKLIQNTLDIGFNIGQSFRTGEIVAIPFGLFSILDYSFENGYHSYLVIMNDYSVQYKPFYIESDRRLDSIGQMRVQYVGTAQYLSGRVPRDTLRFREVR